MMTRSALLAATVGAAITLTACDVSVLNKSFSDEHAVPQRFTSVLIDSGSGDFTIRYKEGAAASIRRTVEHTSSNTPSGVFHTVEGEALVLRDCGNNCTINYEVTIPSKDIHLRGDLGSGDLTAEGLRAVDYRTGSGNVQIRDITQSVKIDSSSGDVTVERIGGPLTAHLGSGNLHLTDVKGKAVLDSSSGQISGSGLGDEVAAKAGSGNVVLTLTAKKNVRVEANSGDITLGVPSGPYKISLDQDSGEDNIEVATDPASPDELTLIADSGNVWVRPA